MFDPVSNDQPRDMMGKVVQTDLVKYPSGNGNRRSLALHEDYCITQVIIYQDVGPLLHFIKNELLFYSDQWGRKSFFSDQVLDKVLPDPFLGGQDDILLADDIKNIISTGL